MEITALVQTIGGILPEELVQLLGDGTEETPEQHDEVLELRCSSL